MIILLTGDRSVEVEHFPPPPQLITHPNSSNWYAPTPQYCCAPTLQHHSAAPTSPQQQQQHQPLNDISPSDDTESSVEKKTLHSEDAQSDTDTIVVNTSSDNIDTDIEADSFHNIHKVIIIY